MAKRKIEKKHIYEGLGFPIILRNVPMTEFRGVWAVDIDLNILQKAVLLELAFHPADLTGDQIHFIRSWLEMSQTEFGALLGVTHPAVVKWEKKEDQPSSMNITTQRDLRMLLLDRLIAKDADFRKAFRSVHITEFSEKPDLLEFDVSKDLMAI